MSCILVKQLKNKFVLTINDGTGTPREVILVKDQEYILNPLNKRYDKNRGRKVIFKSIEQNGYECVAKIKYLDTKRPGRVPVVYLENVYTEVQTKKEPVKDRQEPLVLNELAPFFQLYLDILNVLDNKKDQSHIAHITQKQIAELVDSSPTNVSKRLNQLNRYGAIESISPGVYKVLNNSLWYTPYRTVHKVISLVSERPELIKLYKEQAIILEVSLDDITQAWAFINYNGIN
ncbi:MAG: winged helix-turn-helix domain-containing protein [Bacillota bacterium]